MISGNSLYAAVSAFCMPLPQNQIKHFKEEAYMRTKKLVVSAMLIAVAAVLSIFQPFQLPFGGGITIASMMPIVLIAYCYGTPWGLLSALILRYIVHINSGAIFFGAWEEWFFTQEGFYAIGAKIMAHCSGGMLALIYSIFYNGTYMIPEIIITAILTPIVYKALSAANLIDTQSVN